MNLDDPAVASAVRADPSEAFCRYFEASTLSTAGLPSGATLFQAAQIIQRIAEKYETLLRNLCLIDTFVMTQLRLDAVLLEPRACLHHVRDEGGRM